MNAQNVLQIAKKKWWVSLCLSFHLALIYSYSKKSGLSKSQYDLRCSIRSFIWKLPNNDTMISLSRQKKKPFHLWNHFFLHFLLTRNVFACSDTRCFNFFVIFANKIGFLMEKKKPNNQTLIQFVCQTQTSTNFNDDGFRSNGNWKHKP